MKEKIIYEDKAILNLPGNHGTASTSIYLHTNEIFHDGLPSIDGQLSISDCARVIHLDLNAYDKDTYTNSIYKLSTLLKIIGEAHTKLLANQSVYNAEYDEAKAKYDKKEKKKKKKAKAEKKAAKSEKKAEGVEAVPINDVLDA